MKLKSGIVRRIDNLGRVVIPKEMRKELEIEERDPVNISIEDGAIIIKKYQNKCVFCGALNPINIFKDKRICKRCWNMIKNDE